MGARRSQGTRHETTLPPRCLYEIEGLEAPPEEREMDLLLPPASDLGNVVIELENAGVNVGTESTRAGFSAT